MFERPFTRVLPKYTRVVHRDSRQHRVNCQRRDRCTISCGSWRRRWCHSWMIPHPAVVFHPLPDIALIISRTPINTITLQPASARLIAFVCTDVAVLGTFEPAEAAAVVAVPAVVEFTGAELDQTSFHHVF